MRSPIKSQAVGRSHGVDLGFAMGSPIFLAIREAGEANASGAFWADTKRTTATRLAAISSTAAAVQLE